MHVAVHSQPSWCFGKEERHNDQDERQNDLDDKWTLPRHLVRKHEVEAIVYPARQHISSNQARVLNAHHQASAMRSCDLSLNDGDSHGEEADAETLDSATGDEGGKVRSKNLDEGAEEVDEAADTDTFLSTDDVAKSACDESA